VDHGLEGAASTGAQLAGDGQFGARCTAVFLRGQRVWILRMLDHDGRPSSINPDEV
jgi:hypothetical protein